MYLTVLFTYLEEDRLDGLNLEVSLEAGFLGLVDHLDEPDWEAGLLLGVDHQLGVTLTLVHATSWLGWD